MPNQQPTPTPSLLLTKRLTAFLSANLGPQVHTAVLTTLSGKLLAHASPHPVGTLRTQCTVAASIWALYSEPDTVVEALPQSQPQSAHPPHPPTAVTIQLTAGVMVIRRLRCGLLFVCIGPSATAGSGAGAGAGNAGGEGDYVTQTPARTVPQQQQQHQHQHQSQQHLNTNNTTEPHPQTPLGSPSEVESVVSAGAATTASVATTTASVGATAVVATRRQAEELARWLTYVAKLWLGPLRLSAVSNRIE